MGACPRGGIIFPLWSIVLIGFGDYLYYDDSKVVFVINCIVVWIILYLAIYALIPSKTVQKHYNEWLKSYDNKTVLWSALYFIGCVAIGFLILGCRGR